MLQRVAVGLPTQTGIDGAITIVSDWQKEPYVKITYYINEEGEASATRLAQVIAIDDAKTLYDFFANVYNEFAEKSTWTPHTNK